MDMMGGITSKRLQVNMHSVILVADEVALEPITRVASGTNESFECQSFHCCLCSNHDYWLMGFATGTKVQERAQRRQDKTLLATARQY